MLMPCHSKTLRGSILRPDLTVQPRHLRCFRRQRTFPYQPCRHRVVRELGSISNPCLVDARFSNGTIRPNDEFKDKSVAVFIGIQRGQVPGMRITGQHHLAAVVGIQGDTQARGALRLHPGRAANDPVWLRGDPVRVGGAARAELERARDESGLPKRPDVARGDALLRRIGEELARRFVAQAPGPFGADAPKPPEVVWSE